MNFQQAGFERAARENEQAARDEVHGAVAQATEMSRAEMRRKGAHENQAEQPWTSHQVVLLNEMSSVVCPMKQRQKFTGIQGKVTNICKKYQQSVQHHVSEVQTEVQFQLVASGEEVDYLRHELTQCLVEGSHYQNLETTSRCGASENSSEIQQVQQELDHLTVRRRKLEDETLRCQSAVSLFEAQIPRSRGMLEVERQKSTTRQADVLRLRANNSQISQGLDRSEEEVAQLQGRCNDTWRNPEPTLYTRDVAYLSLEWMHIEEEQPESATWWRNGY